jgi:hypothetical protein
MQMDPLTVMHQVVEIRYGYSIQDNQYHTHFEWPAERQGQPALQRAVLFRFPEASSETGKGHFVGATKDEALAAARSAIDRYLGLR